jgi:hypothetical protein
MGRFRHENIHREMEIGLKRVYSIMKYTKSLRHSYVVFTYGPK